MRLAQFRGLRDDPRVFTDRADQVAFAIVGEQREVGALPAEPEVGGVPRNRRQPRVRVLHVVDGVLARGGRPQCQIDVDALVHGRAHQRVPGCVDADGLDQVVERDDCAGTLAHLHGLAVAHEVDHLADHDLDGVGIVTEGRRCGLQPGDVTVVVGAEHVDAQVEAA